MCLGINGNRKRLSFLFVHSVRLSACGDVVVPMNSSRYCYSLYVTQLIRIISRPYTKKNCTAFNVNLNRQLFSIFFLSHSVLLVSNQNKEYYIVLLCVCVVVHDAYMNRERYLVGIRSVACYASLFKMKSMYFR